jgi:cell cycle control protein 50
MAGNSWRSTGIAWSSDIGNVFKHEDFTGSSIYTNLDLNNNPLPRVDDEELIVWMRPAALPTFRKLHRIIEGTSLKAGDQMQFTINQSFNTTQFGGHKSVVLSTTSWMGSKNEFQGWAFIVVGALSFLLAVLFLIKQTVSPRPLGDMTFFTWAMPVPTSNC